MSITSLSNPFDIKHFRTIYNNTDPRILNYYFQKKDLLIDKDSTLLYKSQSKEEHYRKTIFFIKNLSAELQEKLLFDFKIINFFANPSQVNKANKINIKFLLHYLKETYNKDIEFWPPLSLYDQIVYIFVNFQKGFYEAYSLYAHFEFNKTINTKTKNILDTELILQKMIIDKKFELFIKPGSYIQDFYINQLTLINLSADNSEISIDAKHVWQNSKEYSSHPFYKLLEHHNIRNPMLYKIKEIEIVAVINIPYINKNFRKCFIINHEGKTSLGFETIDQQIKECLKEYEVVKKPPLSKECNSFFFIVWSFPPKFIYKSRA